jgi:hypothetical protein
MSAKLYLNEWDVAKPRGPYRVTLERTLSSAHRDNSIFLVQVEPSYTYSGALVACASTVSLATERLLLVGRHGIAPFGAASYPVHVYVVVPKGCDPTILNQIPFVDFETMSNYGWGLVFATRQDAEADIEDPSKTIFR